MECDICQRLAGPNWPIHCTWCAQTVVYKTRAQLVDVLVQHASLQHQIQTLVEAQDCGNLLRDIHEEIAVVAHARKQLAEQTARLRVFIDRKRQHVDKQRENLAQRREDAAFKASRSSEGKSIPHAEKRVEIRNTIKTARNERILALATLFRVERRTALHQEDTFWIMGKCIPSLPDLLSQTGLSAGLEPHEINASVWLVSRFVSQLSLYGKQMPVRLSEIDFATPGQDFSHTQSAAWCVLALRIAWMCHGQGHDMRTVEALGSMGRNVWLLTRPKAAAHEENEHESWPWQSLERMMAAVKATLMDHGGDWDTLSEDIKTTHDPVRKL